MRLTVSIRNAGGTIANLKAAEKSVLDTVKQVVGKYGTRTQARVQELCPVDTGFMVDHTRTVFTSAGYVYETGWLEEDFAEVGLTFYPPFVIFGTQSMPARPILQQAHAEIAPEFARALASALKQTAEGARAR